jgi:hypothetical protein
LVNFQLIQIMTTDQVSVLDDNQNPPGAAKGLCSQAPELAQIKRSTVGHVTNLYGCCDSTHWLGDREFIALQYANFGYLYTLLTVLPPEIP